MISAADHDAADRIGKQVLERNLADRHPKSAGRKEFGRVKDSARVLDGVDGPGEQVGEHVEQGADVTVGVLEVPRHEASGFGVMQVDAQDRIISFLEKPADPPGLPDDPDSTFASMGTKVRLSSIAAGQSREISWDVPVSAPTRGQWAPLRIRIDGNSSEINPTNDEAWLWTRFAR